MKPLTLEDVSAGIRELPSLPVVVLQLLGSIEKEEADVPEIARKIAQDQALVAKVLRVANSSFYGMQGKVTSMRDAIAVLGIRSVRTLVVAAAVTGNFPASQRSWFDQHAFWKHSLAVALAARAFADALRQNADHAFTSGLLHDIGRLVLVTCFPEYYRAVVDRHVSGGGFIIDAERSVLGFDHMQVGAALAERWKFSPAVGDAVRCHHPVAGCELPAAGALIHLADVTAHVLDVTGEEHAMVPPLNVAAWKRFGISWPEYKRRLAEIEIQHRGATLLLAA
jgi:putative nucleotidyltransferase with HDIG domain